MCFIFFQAVFLLKRRNTVSRKLLKFEYQLELKILRVFFRYCLLQNTKK